MRKKHRTKNHYDVVSVGSILRDITYYSEDIQVINNPHKDATLQKFLAVEYGAKLRSNDVYVQAGGGASNSSINFANLDLQTAVIACVGNDEDGDIVLNHLDKHNVDTRYIKRSATERTGFSFIAVVPDTGDRTVFAHYGASEELPLPAATLHTIDTEWFYVSSLAMPEWSQLLKMIIGHPHAKFAWNPGSMQLSVSKRILRSLLHETDVLIVNRDEGVDVACRFGYMKKEDDMPTLKDIAFFLRTLGPEIVLVTDGRNGSVAADKNGTVYQPAPKAKPKDTTGAGDCFGSSFLAGLIHFQGDIPLAMDLAQTNVNSLVKHVGAHNGLVSWQKMPTRLKKHRID